MSSENIENMYLDTNPGSLSPQKVDQKTLYLASDVRFTRSVSEFNFVSVLIPEEMWDFENFSPSRVIQYWELHSISPTTRAIPCVELIVSKFLDPDFVFPVAERFIHSLFRIRKSGVENVPVCERYVNLKFCSRRMKSVCSHIENIIGYNHGTPELQQYCDLVKAMAPLASSEEQVIRKVLEQERGSITALAQNCSIQNINWIMSKLKMNVSLPLIHELFGNPTILGKLNAIWKLLEVHEVLWTGIQWSFVQNAVQHLYTMLTWLMEKCAGFADIISDKFKWVKAKIVKDPKIVTTQNEEDLLTGIELSTATMNINDCLYDAVAPQLNLSPLQLKEKFLQFVNKLTKDRYQQILTLEGAEFKEEMSFDEFQRISDSQEMLTDIHSVFMGYCFDTNIVTFAEAELIARDIYGMRSRPAIYLDNRNLHFRPANPQHITVVTHWGNQEAVHTPPTCPCGQFATSTCSSCGTEVCLACWMTHCQTKLDLTINFDPLELSKLDQEHPDSIFQGDMKKPIAKVGPVEKVKEAQVLSPPPINVDTIPSFQDRLWDHWYKICDFFKNLNFSEIGRKTADFLKNLFGNVYAWLKTNPVMVSLMGVFASVASLLGFTLPSITNPADKRSLVSKLGDATRNLYYVQRTSGNLIETFKGFGDAMADVLGYNTDESIDLFKKRVLEASEKADKLLLLAETNPGKFVNDRKEMQQYESAVKDIDKIYHDLIKVSEKVNIQAINPIWMKLNKSTQSLKQIYTRWACNVSERQEPVVMWIYGETNLGKSRILNSIVKKLKDHYGRDWEVFTLSKGTDHWNGFTGQEIIKFDDFAATRPNGENTDAMNLMNLKTSASFNPSMAALEEKNIMAKPKFILVASNAPSIDLGSGIQDIAAFERRRDVFVKVSWPDHEGSCNRIANCHHIQELAKKLEQTGEETFEHLVLTNVDPNVSEINGRSQKTHIIQRSETSIEDIVNTMITLEESYKMKYERAITALNKQTDSDVVANVVFQDYPNIGLIGPPGTGKSYIMQAVSNKFGDAAQNIKTPEEFSKFVEKGRPEDNKSVVIIDDLSSHVGSPYIDKFLLTLKNRSEQISENTIPWIMGINKGVLNHIIHRAFQAGDDIERQAEVEDMFYRRFKKFETSFKNEFFLNLGMKLRVLKEKPADRLKKKLSEGKSIEEYVQFKSDTKNVTQKTIIDELCVTKTVVKRVEIEMTMPLVPPKKPDMYMKFLMTSEEFFEVINRDSLAEVLKLLRSERVLVNSGILPRSTLFARIAKSVTSARNYAELAFSDFESFFHQASNDGHLNNFSENLSYLIFSNVVYGIESVSPGKARAVKIIDTKEGIIEAKIELAGVADVIKTADFLAFSISNFSPWFCFVGDLITTLGKVGFSFLSVAKSVSDQHKFYRSARMVSAIEEGAQNYLNHEMDGISQRFNSDFIQNDRRGNAAYSVNTPERGIFDAIRNETEPPNKRVNKGIMRKPTILKKETEPHKTRTDVSRSMRRENEGDDSFQNAETICGLTTEYEESISRISGKKIKAVTQAVMPISEVEKLKKTPVYQAVIDNSVLPIAEAIIPNFIRIFNNNNKFCCYGLMIKDNIGTTVWHIQQNPQMYIAEDIEGNRYNMEFFNAVIDDDKIDFKLTPLDHSAQRSFRNIVRHIIPQTYNGYEGMQGILMNVTRSNTGKLPVVVMRIYSIVRQTAKWCEDVNMIINLIEYKGYKMGSIIPDVMTRNGDCGSILIVSDPAAPEGRIIGMHSRASQTQAYVRPMYKENYLHVERQLANTIHIGKYMNEARKVLDRDYEGVLNVKLYQPETTKLFRNLAPIGEELYEPSLLSQNDTRNPGIDMIGQESEKWIQQPPVLSMEDKNIYRKAVGLFSEHYANVLLRNDKKLAVLTKRQAINKYRMSVHSEPIPVQTSPGFPWNHFSNGQGKREFMEVDEKTGARRFTHARVTRKLFDAIDRLELYCAEEGSCEEPIFQIALKDEPLKKKKIYDQAQTRTIACSPLHFTVLLRQYTHSIVACLNDCQNEVSCAVGIDPTSNDWDFMVRKAISVGKSAIAADYKGWDFTVHPFEIECMGDFYVNVMRICNPSFTERQAKIIRSLYRLLARPLIAVHSKLYRVLRGIMSGESNTANDNSHINEFRKYFAWYKIMAKSQPQLCGFDHFKKHTSGKYYGDDHFIVVADFLKDIYNAKIIQEVEEPIFGVQLTSPDKESEMKPTVDIMKITFMSREFHLQGHKFVGRLEWPRVLKPTHWVHDNRKHKFWETPNAVVHNLEAAFQAYESALLAALPWGKLKYDSIREPAQLAFSKVGYSQQLPDFDTLFMETFECPPSEEALLGCSFSHITATERSKNCGIVRPRVAGWAQDFGNRKSWHYGPSYKYSGVSHETREPTPQVQDLLDYVNKRYDRKWNSALFNWYPPRGRIPFHRDDEKEIDPNEGVGCLTVYGGGTIGFIAPNEPLYERLLNPGDFYIMEQENLVKFKHARYDHSCNTLSVTFRKIDSV